MSSTATPALVVPVSDEKKLRALVGASAVVIIILLLAVSGYYYSKQAQPELLKEKESEVNFRSALEMSVGGKDPKPLQNFFVKNVKDGNNNDDTKSAIYWITHRFFDNGGNIYEIYDFIEAHKELVFLKEAEMIYPDTFKLVKEKKVKNYSGDALLALLAYYEVIDKYGYGTIGVWGMAANKYSEFALIKMQEHLINPKKQYLKPELNPLYAMSLFMDKSVLFANKGSVFLTSNTRKTKKLEELNTLTIIPDDLLVGLNQYGSALQNLKAAGRVISTPFSALEIYNFNFTLVSTKVPRLYFFTNYLYAASLVYGKDATKESVRVPLSRAVEYAETTNKAQWRGSVTRVIDSKTSGEISMYNYEVVKKLAALDEGFKKWLMKNGWTEADFK